MHVIYVGDARDVLKRIRTNHCSGNVEASALRRYVAESMGYDIRRERRPSGSTRLRIDLPDPRQGEIRISNYIRNGLWRVIVCDGYQLANDFQWYVIEQLRPLLNRIRQNYLQNKLPLYQQMLQQLVNSPLLNYSDLCRVESGPGVYVLYHQLKP